MKLIPFTSITPFDVMEKCPETVYINPEEVIYVTPERGRKGSAIIALIRGTFTVDNTPEEVIKILSGEE